MEGLKSKINWHYVFFTLITVLFMFTRLFRLDTVPFHNGIHWDEWGSAYDAWCISGWGVDRYLVGFPLYFNNTGFGQSALLIYSAALMDKLFGFSMFKFRLVVVIYAFLAYICLYFLSKEAIEDKYLRLIPNALMAITPFFLMSEHWGLDCNLFLSMIIISLYFMVKAIKSGKNLWYVIDGILWGITFYSYGMSYTIIPLFMICSLIYLLYIGKVNLKNILGMAVPMILLGIPLALEQMVIAGIIEPFSIGRMDFRPIKYQRAELISIKNIKDDAMRFFGNIFSGGNYDESGQENVPIFGTTYWISIPPMIIGMVLSVKDTVKAFKKKTFEPIVLVLFLYAVMQVIALMIQDGPRIHQVNGMFFPFLVFTSTGLIFLVKKFNNRGFNVLVLAVYSVTFLFFARWVYSYGDNSWTSETSKEKMGYLHLDTFAAEAVREAKEISDGRHIQIMINFMEAEYDQICLFTGTSPYDYNEEGYDENGYDFGVPDELDLTGDTVYLIDGELSHVTEFLVSEGFENHVVSSNHYSVVYK